MQNKCQRGGLNSIGLLYLTFDIITALMKIIMFIINLTWLSEVIYQTPAHLFITQYICSSIIKEHAIIICVAEAQ